MEAFYLKQNENQLGGEGEQESGKKRGNWFTSFFTPKEELPEKQQEPLPVNQEQSQNEHPKTGMISKLTSFLGFGETKKQPPNNQMGGKKRKNKTRKQKKK